jgi:proton-translocating NADH-quinone oxidoreductase, chain N
MTFPVFSLLPELTLCGGLVLLLLTPFFEKRASDGSSCVSCTTCSGKIVFIIVQVVLWLAIFFICAQGVGEARVTMQALLLRSSLTQALQIAALVATSVALFYALSSLVRDKLLNAETFILLLCTLLGVLTVISATHLILIYLGIELMSLPLYAMVALRKKHLPAAESALKYFFLGALASGLLLYGFSLIYAATGAMSIFDIGRQTGSTTLFMLGMIFVLVGMMFKLSVVPFHMWAPDVYQGAPTFITLYISTVPKFAAVILLLRLLSSPLASLTIYWQSILVVLAALSMILGAVAAILQTNIKRMLAYSTIGHMGYLLLGVLTGSTAGYSASLFYILVYAITNLVAFGVLLSMVTEESDNDGLGDFRGLYQRSPLRALLMGAAMFSLAGIPPFIGFFGKFAVIEVAFNSGFFWLSIIAILTSVIAAFYYLRVVLLMFFAEPEASATKNFTRAPLSMVLLSGNGLALLVLGIFPNAILGWLVYVVAQTPIF